MHSCLIKFIKEFRALISEVILSVMGVTQIDELKVRTYMNQVYVDVEIGIDENYSFKKAHEISEEVHHKVESEGGALHCMVHANPIKEENKKPVN